MSRSVEFHAFGVQHWVRRGERARARAPDRLKRERARPNESHYLRGIQGMIVEACVRDSWRETEVEAPVEANVATPGTQAGRAQARYLELRG